MQYTILSTAGTDGFELSDLTDTFRVMARGDDLNFDQEITSSGLDGVEDTDWGNIDKSSLPGTNQGTFRIGVRNLYWVIDQAKTILGFSGVENTDWETIEQHKLS